MKITETILKYFLLEDAPIWAKLRYTLLRFVAIAFMIPILEDVISGEFQNYFIIPEFTLLAMTAFLFYLHLNLHAHVLRIEHDIVKD